MGSNHQNTEILVNISMTVFLTIMLQIPAARILFDIAVHLHAVKD